MRQGRHEAILRESPRRHETRNQGPLRSVNSSKQTTAQRQERHVEERSKRRYTSQPILRAGRVQYLKKSRNSSQLLTDAELARLADKSPLRPLKSTSRQGHRLKLWHQHVREHALCPVLLRRHPRLRVQLFQQQSQRQSSKGKGGDSQARESEWQGSSGWPKEVPNTLVCREHQGTPESLCKSPHFIG